jgi:hypothetical protein
LSPLTMARAWSSGIPQLLTSGPMVGDTVRGGDMDITPTAIPVGATAAAITTDTN